MPGPLAGQKILDFSTLYPGPFATMMLGDLGAEVLKVEAPSRPDNVRLGPPYDGQVSACHMALNRNKRSIALNLKTPEGVALVKRLVRTYDIVLEQFRPGVMKRLGLDYETLGGENQGLIYSSLTGYGQDGPYRLPGQAMSSTTWPSPGFIRFQAVPARGLCPRGISSRTSGAAPTTLSWASWPRWSIGPGPVKASTSMSR